MLTKWQNIMDRKKYIAYYRVSTEEQGKSGLGLSAQRQSVRGFIEANGVLAGEYQDIESGSSNTREGINLAIQACKKEGATLVVKEMSRISRGGFKIMVALEEENIDFIESVAPHDPAMVKGLKFVMAKEEREKISERTKSALSQIQEKLEKGEKHMSKSGRVVEHLGSPENLTDKARERSIAVRSRKANEDPNNRKAGAFIVALKDAGKNFSEITKSLNKAGFMTRRGGEFSQTQTQRLYKRFKNLETV